MHHPAWRYMNSQKAPNLTLPFKHIAHLCGKRILLGLGSIQVIQTAFYWYLEHKKIQIKVLTHGSPEGYELWHPNNWPVTTTNHLPPHLANYLGHQRVSQNKFSMTTFLRRAMNCGTRITGQLRQPNTSLHTWPITWDIKGCQCLFKHHSPKHTPDW